MAAELDYFVVDVFTRSALQGNPLAVVLDTAGLATERMQAIAREFNLSETTFIQRRPAAIEPGEGVRVRIFTTQEELPFAGHPTLGTASVLKTVAPEAIRDNILTLALNVGPVPVRFDEKLDDSGSVFGEMTQRDPEFGAELEPDKVAWLTGLDPDDLDPNLPPQIVSTGNAFVIVVLRSADALARLSVKHAEATPWLRERGGGGSTFLLPRVRRNPGSALACSSTAEKILQPVQPPAARSAISSRVVWSRRAKESWCSRALRSAGRATCF